VLHERYLKLVERVKDDRSGPGLKDKTSVEETATARQVEDVKAGNRR